MRGSDDHGDSFLLTLADGLSWQISAAPSLRPWAESLAQMMELPVARGQSGARHLWLTEWGSLDARVLREAGQWHTLAMGTAARVWWRPSAEEAFVELDPVLLAHPQIRVMAMWAALRPLQFEAISRGGGPVHAGLAVCEGKGVLIAADAGVGKSTSIRRLPAPWQGLCDDYALVVKCGEDRYAAHPFPTFSARLGGDHRTSWNAGRSVQLAAVFFLEQASTDSVEPLKPESAVHLFEDALEQLIDTCLPRLDATSRYSLRLGIAHAASQMSRSIPAYLLRASLTGRFWEGIESALMAMRQPGPSPERA